jgi:hypothetical protein
VLTDEVDPSWGYANYLWLSPEALTKQLSNVCHPIGVPNRTLVRPLYCGHFGALLPNDKEIWAAFVDTSDRL